MPDLTPDPSLRRPPAPGRRDAVLRAGRRRRAAALGAGVLALAVLTAVPVGALALRDDGRDTLFADGVPTPPPPTVEPTPDDVQPPAEPCPDRLPTASPPAVPAPPPAELAGALVPEEVPMAVTICRYGDASAFGSPDRRVPAEVSLDGERQVVGGLAELPADLALPAGTEVGFCTARGGPVVPYLARLSYPAGTVWVSTSSDPNSCALVSNGDFTSATYVGDQVEASYEAGTWVQEPPRWNAPSPSGCPTTTAGRAGQERELVPEGWDELVVCRTADGVQTVTPVDDERANQIVDLLRPLTTSPADGFSASCDQQQPVAGADRGQLLLMFGYPSGRSVHVIPFLGCDPPLSNGSLAAGATPQQQAELLRLLEGD